MKTSAFFLFAFLSWTLAFSSENDDLRDKNLKGNVKSVRLTTYKALQKNGNVVKGKRKLESRYDLDYYILFNEKGYKTEHSLFEADGSLYVKVVYQNSEQGNVIQEDRYNAKGLLLRQIKSTYTYDSAGRVIEKTRNTDGKISKHTFKYDEKGNLLEWDIDGKPAGLNKYNDKGQRIELSTLNADGSVYIKYVYAYDDKGNKKEETWYKGSKFRIKYLWQYDDRGNVIQCVWVNEKGKPSKKNKWSYKYEYDGHGNWTKQIEYHGKKPIFVTERQIEYY